MRSENVYSSASPLRQYVNVIFRRKWWLIGALVGCLAAACVWTFTVTPLYTATAQITYKKQADISAAVLGTSTFVSSVDVERELETYASLMTTEDMRGRALDFLKLPDDTDLDATVSSEAIKDTALLRVTVTSPDAKQAQLVANAYALSFVASRKTAILDGYERAQTIIEGKLDRYDPVKSANDPGYIQLNGRLQDLKVLASAATGDFAMAALAPLPTEPSSPNHTRDILLGLFVGVLLGLILVAVVEQLDVRVHTQEDIAAGTGLPLLGRLPRVSRELGRTTNLAVLKEPEGPSAEAFRMLRGNLDFVNVDGEVASFLFTSPTQGEGKTTTVCNLAVTLARIGKKVIVVDCDLRRPRVHTYFGLLNRDGVSTVVSGRCGVIDVLQPVVVPTGEEDIEGRGIGGGGGTVPLHVLTAGPLPPNPGEIAASRKLGSMLNELNSLCDVLLVDAPPFLAVGDAAALAHSIGGVILVTRLGTLTKAMLREATDYVRTLPCRKLGVVVTNLPIEARSYRYKYYRDAGATEPEPQLEPETPATV